MVLNYWSESEIELLKTCCTEGKSLHETQQLFDRKPLSIILKIRSISPTNTKHKNQTVDRLRSDETNSLNDIYKKRNSKWTAQDEENLVFYFEKQRYSLEKIADLFDRSPMSIYKRLELLYPTITSLEKVWQDCKMLMRLVKIEKAESTHPKDVFKKWVDETRANHRNVYFHKRKYCIEECPLSLYPCTNSCQYTISTNIYEDVTYVACSFFESKKQNDSI